MKTLSGILGLTLASVAALASANAADLNRGPEAGGYKDSPVYMTSNWSGFYIGVNGGYGWNNNNQLVDHGDGFDGLSPSGGFGGAQIGFNLQGLVNPHLVLGLEADIQGANFSDSRINPLEADYHAKSELDYFGTVRGRVGYATDRTLFYITGGFAYGGLHKASNNHGDYYEDQTFDGVATGYALGGGLEYKFSPAWSMKAEYQYLNFGKNDVCGAGNTCFSAPENAGPQKDDDYHTVRAGLNYHVGPAYESLK